MLRKIIISLALALSLCLPVPAFAGMSAYLAQALAAQLFNGTAYTFPTTIYIGLYVTCPFFLGHSFRLGSCNVALGSVSFGCRIAKIA